MESKGREGKIKKKFSSKKKIKKSVNKGRKLTKDNIGDDESMKSVDKERYKFLDDYQKNKEIKGEKEENKTIKKKEEKVKPKKKEDIKEDDFFGKEEEKKKADEFGFDEFDFN